MTKKYILSTSFEEDSGIEKFVSISTFNAKI